MIVPKRSPSPTSVSRSSTNSLTVAAATHASSISLGPDSGIFKVLRGGSWHDEQPAALRFAARNFDDPRKRNYYYGFRIAMDI